MVDREAGCSAGSSSQVPNAVGLWDRNHGWTMTDLCPNCKQPKAGGKSGSLTQWIFICHCDSLRSEETTSDTDSYKFQICRTCRKRVNTGREGSLTQFVFRSDSCRCEFPELVDVAVARATETLTEFTGNDTKSLQEQIDEIEGIELSPDSFPTNRFKPIREIGRGASGAVYLCIDRLLGNKVAVKTLHYLAADQLLGFQQEARAISKLTHPNIVKILDFGATDGGTPYMVLEYIDGVDLETLVARSGPLSLGKILEVILSVCDALSYSHLKEIYHRDLKPSNILIEESAQRLNAKLVDFGVARIKFETQEPTICHGTNVIGTPAYMSPDQMRGISYDQRSELYSLGCILFELLSGRQLYTAETVLELVALHANAPIPLLSEVKEGAEFPAELDKILARCLAKSPEDRYQSVHALKTDLSKILELAGQGDKRTAIESSQDEPLGARIDHRTLSELSRQSTRKGKIAALAVSAIVVAVASTSAYFVFNPNQNKNDIYAPPSPNTPAPKQKAGDLGNSLMETKFNINEFNGNKWLFNMGEVKDIYVDEILKSPHSNRLWFDQGSLSPAALLRLKPAKVISFAIINMPVSDAHLEALAELKTLKLLRLFENPSLHNESLRYIQPMDNLSELMIRNSRITDRGIRHLAGMKNLEILSLDRCTYVSDKCLDVIEGMSSLNRLSLAATKVSKQGILRIAKLKKLHTISLANLPCDSECVSALIKLPLKNLSLRGTPLTKKDLMRLSELKNLKLLDVRDCSEITKTIHKRFVENRILLKLPPCQLIRERRVGMQSFGEMVYETLDDEHMWVD